MKCGRWLTIAACTSCVLFVLCILVLAQFRGGGPPWAHTVASSRTIRVGDATIQVDFGPGSFDLPKETILHWVGNAASSVSTYYGRFPMARDRVLIEAAPG